MNRRRNGRRCSNNNGNGISTRCSFHPRYVCRYRLTYEFTKVDSIKPLLDENGEFQIGVDGAMVTTPPDACPTGSEPIQVGKLSESEAWRKQFSIDADELMKYGNRCHVYSFVLSFDGTTATLYSTDSQ